jgi:hypothetical protein
MTMFWALEKLLEAYRGSCVSDDVHERNHMQLCVTRGRAVRRVGGAGLELV